LKTHPVLAVAMAVIATPESAQSQDRVPREPARREAPNVAPEWEPGREGGGVPYVRGDHWYGLAAPNDPRFHLEHPFEHGRFALAGPSHRYSVLRVDLGARRVWLAGGYSFEIAAWEWAFTAPWCWDCPDEYVIYLDPDHPGWYLLYNIRFGEYVHVQYLGI